MVILATVDKHERVSFHRPVSLPFHLMVDDLMRISACLLIAMIAPDTQGTAGGIDDVPVTVCRLPDGSVSTFRFFPLSFCLSVWQDLVVDTQLVR